MLWPWRTLKTTTRYFARETTVVQDVYQGFEPQDRLLKRKQFDHVMTYGRSVADRRLVVYTRENELSRSRLGLVVGRKVGKAVRRNRVKRLLRAAFRLSRPRLPSGLDIVVIARGRDGPERLAATQESLVDLAQRSLKSRPRARPARRK